MTNHQPDDPVAPILAALAAVLQDASGQATEALHADKAGKRSQAMGTLCSPRTITSSNDGPIIMS